MKKIAFLFPGQGSQYVGMGNVLVEKYPIAKQTFEEANDILGFDLKRMCLQGGLEELSETENTQPAILTVSVAAFRVYMQELGIKPQLSAGHSLGEISALTCAGAINFSDAVRLVRQRGIFMKEAAELGIGGMAAVIGINKDVVEDECIKYSSEQNIVVVSNHNSIDQTVISGHKAAVLEVSQKLALKGAKTVPLTVNAAFHSPIMQAAAERFIYELNKYSYNELNWLVISNVNAKPYESCKDIINNLKKQITHPVRWQESMNYMKENGIDVAIEIGPKTVLKNLMKRNALTILTYSFDKEDDIDLLKDNLCNSRQEFTHTIITKCIQITVCTRNRNWDNEAYQQGVVEPYRRIQKIQDEIEKEGRQPTIEEMKQALEMLQSVFSTKMVPIEEQIVRFNEIFNIANNKDLFCDFEIPKL